VPFAAVLRLFLMTKRQSFHSNADNTSKHYYTDIYSTSKAAVGRQKEENYVKKVKNILPV